MATADPHAPVQFLTAAFEPADWVAVLLKSYSTGGVVQRTGPVSWLQSERCQSWLRAMNVRRYNIFISVNAIVPGRRSRRREAIGAIRHVFLDADDHASVVLSRIDARTDLPNPSYVLHSSPNHAHVFWRVARFDHHLAERLQKHLARELRTDPAATPVTQNTRLPGFFNHKRALPHLVTVEYLDVKTRYGPENFPQPEEPQSWNPAPRPPGLGLDVAAIERARRYLASVPPAIAGEHGDVLTFRVCCRLVRGFALSDDQALTVLAEWNVQCEPPWSREELLDKLRGAARYGREPVGGML